MKNCSCHEPHPLLNASCTGHFMHTFAVKKQNKITQLDPRHPSSRLHSDLRT
eukprot:m.73596 g.73596  ORF g.73596 m.73596 type:complete len:52 (+) comp12370_c0_seq7:2515-2670(+)